MGCGINYYEHHIGDFLKDTLSLSLAQEGAYRRLIDVAYSQERPLPLDVEECYRLARATSKPDKEAVRMVLGRYFTKCPDGYRQKRIDKEIEKAQDRINAARENGKAGGRPKKNPAGSKDETKTKPTGFPLGSISETQTITGSKAPTSHLSTAPQEESSLRSLSGARAEVVSRETLSPDFEDFVMANCPNTAHRKNWPSAFMGARAIVGSGRASEADLRRRWLGFGAFAASGGYSDPSKVPSPQSWFAFQQQGEAYWGKEWGPVPSKAQVAQDANIATSQAWLHQQEARDAAN